jgi:hypothetical protein
VRSARPSDLGDFLRLQPEDLHGAGGNCASAGVGLAVCRPDPPTWATSSGCSRRVFLKSEGVCVSGCEARGLSATPSGLGDFLRLQSEGLHGVGGCVRQRV